MKHSAGILMFRERAGGHEFFLIHPGGPFWRNRDDGAWSVPKGAHAENEESLACREFEEETGFRPEGDFIELGTFKQPGGKRVQIWAVEGDLDPARLTSNVFEMEWPPRSGRRAQFPEADRGGWFDAEQARAKLLIGQRPVIDRFFEIVASTP